MVVLRARFVALLMVCGLAPTAFAVITIVVTRNRPRVTATFVGKVNKAGLSSIRQPGTMTNTLGARGTWYAVRASGSRGASRRDA